MQFRTPVSQQQQLAQQVTIAFRVGLSPTFTVDVGGPIWDSFSGGPSNAGPDLTSRINLVILEFLARIKTADP